MKMSSRDRELIALWRERPDDEKTEFHIMDFYSFIKENHPHLFNGITYDPYQYLNGLLKPWFRNKH